MTCCISSAVNLLPESLLHSWSLWILASSNWADVYSIACFSRESPLMLDLFPSFIIFTSLHDLSPAPIPRRFDWHAKIPSTWVYGNEYISCQILEQSAIASLVQNWLGQSKGNLMDWKFLNSVQKISTISSIVSLIISRLGQGYLCSFTATSSIFRCWDPVSQLIAWERISGCTEKVHTVMA